MGGGFGNKNQCQDSDLIAAVLARETGSAVKLEYTRKEDFLGVPGRWPTRQYYRVGATRDGTLQAIELRGYAGSVRTARAAAASRGSSYSVAPTSGGWCTRPTRT